MSLKASNKIDTNRYELEVQMCIRDRGDFFHLDTWMEIFEECGIDPAFYANRRRSFDEVLPWDQMCIRDRGVIYLKDTVKPGMVERFERLRAIGIKTIMCTGDNPLTAATIAKEAGVDGFIAECKPEDKIDVIKKEQAEGKIVATVSYTHLSSITPLSIPL